jgi:methionine-gamma-lyase
MIDEIHWNTLLAKVTTEHNAYDSLTPPLVQTSTFTFPSAEIGARRFAGEEPGYIYTRLSNPTVRLFETAVATLEGAEDGIAFGSGMGAISAVLMNLLKTGDHLLCSNGLYGSTFSLLELLSDRFQISHSFSMLSTEQEIEDAIAPNTKAVYLETPVNPSLTLVDIEKVAKIAHKHGLPVIVDNTFMSPYLQQPILHGADVVVHSATKYLGGHGDVIAGVAVGKSELIHSIRMTTLKDIGAVMAPFDAWLLLRGMRTLVLRMNQQVKSAQVLVAFLNDHPAVDRVYFPGMNPKDEEIMKKQMRHPGAMISFELKGGIEAGRKLMNQLTLIKRAVSLGDIHSLIQHPASMTHSQVPRDERLKMGLTDGMVRLSVGVEDVEDLQNDLSLALGLTNN